MGKSTKNKKTFIIILIILSIFIVGICLGISKLFDVTQRQTTGSGNNDISRLIKEAYKNDSFQDGFCSYNWDKQHYVDEDIYENIGTINYKGNIYCNSITYIHRSYVSDKIADKTIDSDEGKESIDVEVYKIDEISDELAIAVKEKSTEKYYIFTNYDYTSDNMQEFIEDFGINKDTVQVRVTLSDEPKGKYALTYKGLTADYFINNLLNKAGEVIERKNEIEKTGFSIKFYHEKLDSIISIEVLSDGSLMVVGGGAKNLTFECDISNSLEFINCIRKSCEGYIRYYDK